MEKNTAEKAVVIAGSEDVKSHVNATSACPLTFGASRLVVPLLAG